MATSPLHRNLLLVFVALLSLTTFAFAQSVYQAIVGNPEFVTLNQLTHSDLVLIILCFNLLPAVVLAMVWFVLDRLAPAAAEKFLSASFLLLLALFLMELHRRYLSQVLPFRHNSMLLVIPLAIAAWVVFRYRAEFERFVLVLSPVVLIFPALFLWQAWPEAAPTVAPPAVIANFAAADTGKPHPPIFILVLDELARPALLDGYGNIDPLRFPHFAELARHSTWFNNATANAEYTARSIPVMVTGNFPRGKDPSDASYPDNLFHLLAPEYDITIREVETRFCASPQYHCPDASQARESTHQIKAIAELYQFRIAPKWVVWRLIAGDHLRGEQARFREFLRDIGGHTRQAHAGVHAL
jgi:glucan phosphoethanolaminetransferase (alkaline phosphatase superfamily)